MPRKTKPKGSHQQAKRFRKKTGLVKVCGRRAIGIVFNPNRGPVLSGGDRLILKGRDMGKSTLLAVTAVYPGKSRGR